MEEEAIMTDRLHSVLAWHRGVNGDRGVRGLAVGAGPSSVVFLFSLDPSCNIRQLAVEHLTQISDQWATVGQLWLQAFLGLESHLVQLMSLVFSTWYTVCSLRWLYTCLNTLHAFACIMFSIVFGPKQTARALEIQGWKGLLFAGGTLYCNGLNSSREQNWPLLHREGMLMGSVLCR